MSIKNSILTRSRVRELFDYDPETGVLHWKVKHRRVAKGAIAGSISSNGYRRVAIYGTLYPAHQIIWLWVYGYFPEQIDHINHVRDDNRLANLRKANNTVNSRNRSLSSRNTSGVVGVHWSAKDKRWIAQIGAIKRIYLGSFSTFNDAVLARKEAEVNYGFHPNHG